MRHLLFTFILCIFLGGCFHKEHRLHPNALKVMPYAGAEKLVYISSNSIRDTLFIKGTSSAMVKGGDPFSINPDTFENIRLEYTTSSNANPQGLLYLSNWDTTYQMNFEFNMGHSRLFGYNILTKNEYDQLPDTTIVINHIKYDKVKTLRADTYYEDRPECITHFYWTTSYGLLGWDTSSEQWRLEKE